jgi:fumarate reductase subunit D
MATSVSTSSDRPRAALRIAVERALLALVVLVLLITVYYHATDHHTFKYWFAAEDGPVEWATFTFLALGCVLLLRKARRLRARRGTGAMLLMGLYAFLFFFAAGEEISWGQRVFGWEAGEFFTERSERAETNIHNMKIGEYNLNKVIFGSTLTAVLLLYLLVLPLLHTVWRPARAIAERMVIPVPRPGHAALALIGSLVMWYVIALPRNWEVYELVFALVAAAIFLRPQNPETFR